MRKRQERKVDRDEFESDAPAGVDPDIAGIVPGPQPQPWMDLDDDETAAG